MNKPNFNFVLIVALAITGSIVLGAISSQYPGKIHLKLGGDGVEVQVDGRVK